MPLFARGIPLALAACRPIGVVPPGQHSTHHRLDGTLRFNEVQVLASHNSYKLPLYPEVLAALQAGAPAIAARFLPAARSRLIRLIA